MKKILFNFFIILFFANTISFSQTIPSSILISKITENANYCAAVNLDQFTSNDVDQRWSSAVMERSSQCLKDIEKLAKNPDGASQKFKIVFRKSGNEEEKTMSLEEVKDFALNAFSMARLGELRYKLNQDVLNSLVWFEDLSSDENKLSIEQAEVAKSTGEGFLKHLAEVKSLGLEAQATVETNEPYDYKKMKELAEFTAAAGKKRYDKMMEELFAKDQPFLKKLTGDKLETFKSEFAGNKGMWACYGPGGAALTTPDQLASASTWYTWGNTTNTLIDTWHVTGYFFNGDKLTRTSSKRGIGLKPPASAYR